MAKQEYCFVRMQTHRDDDHSEFVSRVNEKLNEGWVCLGPPQFPPGIETAINEPRYFIIQALVRDIAPEPFAR